MLPALQKAGISIHLHCFDHGRGKQDELLQYCEAVYYYPRNLGHKGISSRLPYIVSSRNNSDLLDKLLADESPILMHGIHCTFLLNDERFRHRKCWVRLHNTEYIYYHHLAKHTRSWMKKIYYEIESRLLKNYEKRITNRAGFLAVSEKEVSIYQQQFLCKQIQHLPVFLPDWSVTGAAGMGNYCFYHGDLQVPSNEKAAIYLLTKVFNRVKIPLVIAGRNPSEHLITLAHRQSHTCLVANPSDLEMEDMIARAHVHILPSFNPTGIQLKWLHALYHGRHIIVQSQLVDNHPLATACYSATNTDAMASLITQLYHQPFTEEERAGREKLLNQLFNPSKQAAQLKAAIFT